MKIIRAAAALTGAILVASAWTGNFPLDLLNQVRGELPASSPIQQLPTQNGGSPIIHNNAGQPVHVGTCTLNLSLPADADDRTVRLFQTAATKFTNETPFTVTVTTGTNNVPVRFQSDTGNHNALAGYRIWGTELVAEHIRINNSLADTFDDSRLLHTYMHEIGHLLGLTHSDQPNTLMYAYTNQTHDFTPEELTSLRTTGQHC